MLDTIRVTKEDYINIINNVQEILTLDKNYIDVVFKPKEIALTTYELAIDDTPVSLRYAYDENTGILRAFWNIQGERLEMTACGNRYDKKEDRVHIHIDYVYKNEAQQWKWLFKCAKSNTSPKQLGGEFAKLFYAINFYLKNLPTEYREAKEKVTETYLENKKGDKRYKTRVVLRRTIYINGSKFSKTKIKHIIKCLCWGVRGHARHLKNGKVIWVKPFRKGIERNNNNAYVSKTYKVS